MAIVDGVPKFSGPEPLNEKIGFPGMESGCSPDLSEKMTELFGY